MWSSRSAGLVLDAEVVTAGPMTVYGGPASAEGVDGDYTALTHVIVTGRRGRRMGAARPRIVNPVPSRAEALRRDGRVQRAAHSLPPCSRAEPPAYLWIGRLFAARADPPGRTRRRRGAIRSVMAMDPIAERVRAALARGEQREAATEAIRGYAAQVGGLLRALLKDDDDAADAFSLFAENVWTSIASFRGESTFRGWAYGIAWHAASRIARDPYRRRRRTLPSAEVSALVASVTSSSRGAPGGRHDRFDTLRDALEPEEKLLLVLRIERELSWEEVAHVLTAGGEDVSEAAARKRFERLKEKLARSAREQDLPD
jgi:RNA polymerase sigma-70 factor, ECF subfamily